MLCPLTLNNQVKGRLLFRLVPQECIKEKCAWYHKAKGQCIIMSIESDLRGIEIEIPKIADRLPPKRTI